MAARKGISIILFSALVILYITDFYTVASGDASSEFSDQGGENNGTGSGEHLKKSAKVVDTVEDLPGSIRSSAKSFEPGLTGSEKQTERHRNQLPGAIGLDGAFDNPEAVDPVDEEIASLLGSKESKPAPSTPSPASSNEATKGGTTGSPSSSKASKPEESKPAAESGTGAGSSGSESELQKRIREKEEEAEKNKLAGADSKSDMGSSGDAKKSEDDASSTASAADEPLPGTLAAKKLKKKRLREAAMEKKNKKGDAETIDEAGPADASEGSGAAEKSKADKESKAEKDADAKSTGEESASSRSGKGKKKKGKKEKPDPASESEPPVDTGQPHPFSRTVVELQVDGNTGPLDVTAVKAQYGKLVKSYLLPFAKGIKRKGFFDILKRKNYSLAPPKSNKGIQAILFQLIKQKVYMLDPYEVAKHSKPFYRSRIQEMIWLLDRVTKSGNVPDTEFLVAIHDCVQTVDKEHHYRGAHFKESSPTFTIVGCNFSDNIPFPMWEGDDQRGGGFGGWDKKMEDYRAQDTVPWAEKENKAVFRGGNRASMYFAKKRDAADRCDGVGRSRLQYLAKENPDLYDVSIGGKCGSTEYTMSRLSEIDHHKYKYILYAEGNCFWADRLNKQVFGPSVILKQETPCGQFWEPLLRPMTHYIPTTFFFDDTTDQIKWANEHSTEVEAIAKNANEFAKNFLSLSGIQAYVEVLLTEYTALLEVKEISPEKGAEEVAPAADSTAPQ